MHLNIEIKNLGKIKKASFQINKFTILAGANSSGKSFITKALYSFFSTINKDFFYLEHLEARQLILLNYRTLRFELTHINARADVMDLLYSLEEPIDRLNEIILAYEATAPFLEENTYTLKLRDSIEGLIQQIIDFEKKCGDIKKYQKTSEILNYIHKQLKNIYMTVEMPIRFLADKYAVEFKDSLKENFQTKNLIDLRGDGSESSIDFNFDELGKITVQNDEVNFELARSGIKKVRDFRSVVFIESPVYWKLKSPLLAAKEQIRYNSVRLSKDRAKALTGVPKHFYDLIDLLSLRSKEKNSTELLEIKDAINEVLGGEIVISDSNELFFNDSKCSKKIDLNLTASGINNLGLLALLIDKNVIKRGSFVFIDEPEVNLHPAWQRVMVEVLYKLSKTGVNVVIATHSQDMLKYIENLMDDMTELEREDHFSILHLRGDGISVSDGQPVKSILNSIQGDLGQTYYEMSVVSDTVINWFRGKTGL